MKDPIEHQIELRVASGAGLKILYFSDRDDEKSPALVRPIEFPFPIPDHLPADGTHVHVPFRLDNGEISHFDLPTRTLR